MKLENKTLARRLSVFDLTMIAIGATIGSGIFLTPSLIARSLNSPFLILFVWIVGGVMALAGALTFAELGAMLPKAGGIYVFLEKSYNPLIGFLYGWAYFLVVNTGGIAALSIAFATYVGHFVPMTHLQISSIAIIGLLIVTAINIFGVKIGGIFSDVFTILKLIGIILLIFIGLFWGSSGTLVMNLNPDDFPEDLFYGLSIAFIGVLWSFGGWQHSTFTAAETKNPSRSVPIALLLGSFIVLVIYLLTNIAYLKMMTPLQMMNSSRIASDALQMVIGPIGGSIIAIAIIISTFGTAGIYTLTAPRIYYAMALDGIFFKRAAALHKTYHTPVFAICLQTGWAIALILFWGTFENLISYVVFTDWIFFTLAGISIFILRRKMPNAERPYKTFGYPVTPSLFVVLSAFVVVNTLFSKPEQAFAGIGFLLIGVFVFYIWKRELRFNRFRK